MSLYEGTNGIQSMDLMGRKMRINQGAPFKAFRFELENFIRQNQHHPVLGREIQDLSEASQKLAEMAIRLSGISKSDPLLWASSTYPALLCFSEVTMAWRLLDLARVAQRRLEDDPHNDFLRGKVLQATYWTGVTLPETLARIDTCLRKGREVIEIPDAAF
jgi:hypothetical protein